MCDTTYFSTCTAGRGVGWTHTTRDYYGKKEIFRY